MTRAELATFLSAIGIYYAAAYLTAYVCGRLVERYGLKVNYTRKINPLVTIGAPYDGFARDVAAAISGEEVVAAASKHGVQLG